MLKSLLNRATSYMSTLVLDGEPSVTRWLALRTTEAMTMIVVMMTIAECHSVWIGKGSDAGIISSMVTISVALITATSLNQNTKLTLDASPKGNPSKVSTPGATVTKGDQSDQNK